MTATDVGIGCSMFSLLKWPFTFQSSSPRSAGFVDPKALMAIRSLELRARVVVEGFWNGLHRSPYHGFSVEFTEYRQYSPGDDTRYLDWRLFARSDRYYLKRFEDETNLRCHLLVDQSRSMNYGSLGYSKSDYARTLAATLAWFLNGQGDAVGLFTFAEQVRDYLPARHRHGHLRQLMLALEKESAGSETNLGRAAAPRGGTGAQTRPDRSHFRPARAGGRIGAQSRPAHRRRP